VRNVEEIERAVDGLSDEEYVEFRRWFLERDFEDWDRQIRIDSDGGKLDFLVREAEEDRASQNVNDL
jgi:hypothetical protein